MRNRKKSHRHFCIMKTTGSAGGYDFNCLFLTDLCNSGWIFICWSEWRDTACFAICRPSSPFSVASDRSLFDGSPNHLTSRSRLFRFESSDYFSAQRKRDVLMNISYLLVRMRGFEPPPKQYRHGPEPCASANSATSAYFVFCCFSTAILEYQI